MEYDDTVFETVTAEDMKMENNWTVEYNQEAGAKNGNFLASNIVSGIKTEQTIGKISFKIREDVEPQETVIKFKNVKSNDGANVVDETDKKITIKIITDTEIIIPTVTPTPLPTVTPTEAPKATPTATSTKSPTNPSDNPTKSPKPTITLGVKDPATSKPSALVTPTLPDVLPQTGIDMKIIALIAIVIINAVVVLIKYKKMDI